MDREKADNISVVLAGAGVILVLVPLFGVMAEQQQGLLFGGVVCLVSAFLIRQLARK